MRFHLRESLLLGCLRLLKALDRRDMSAGAFDPLKVRSILIISSTALGDTVLSTAAFGALRRRYPDARITALIHHAYAALFSRHQDLDELLPYRGGYRAFLRTVIELRRRHFDLALILHGNEPQATPFAYLSGAPFIFKLPNTSRFRFLLSNRDPMLKWSDFRHGIDQRLAVAALAGAAIEGARMSLPAPEPAVHEVTTWLEDHDVTDSLLVGFQVGASSRSRMWPAEFFVELAGRLLLRHPRIRLVILGSPDEGPYCSRVAAEIGPSALVAAGKLPIEALPALIARLALVISGDTGTYHVAVAVGTSTLGLFAVSDPSVSGPAYDFQRHTVIHRPYEKRVRTKSNDPRGMALISVAEVEAAALARLAPAETAP